MREEEARKHSQEIQDRWARGQDELKSRALDREKSNMEYETFLKERKTPAYQQIIERYNDKKRDRAEESNQMLQTIHEGRGPDLLRSTKMKDHIRAYNVHLNIQTMKRKEHTDAFLKDLKQHEKDMGITFNRPKYFDFGRTQSENDRHFAERKKRDAAVEYGRQIKTELFPKIRKTTSPKPLPFEIIQKSATTSKSKLMGLEYSRKLASVGNLYMNQSKKRIKSKATRDQSPISQKLDQSPDTFGPKHHNYLTDIRNSNVLNRELPHWRQIMSNNEFETIDKYECMQAEFEK